MKQVDPALLSHCLDHDAFGALAVPLAVENPLPRPEVELPFRHWNDHFVPDRQRSEMCGSVILASAAVVPVLFRRPRSNSLLEPV